MKIVVNSKEKKEEVPCLVCHRKSPTQLFLLKQEQNSDGTFRGTVIGSNLPEWEVGDSRSNWVEYDFIPFDGEITLSNEW